MKRFLAVVLGLAMLLGLVGCRSTSQENRVVIYSCLEDYRNDYIQKRLNEKFPQYDISIQFIPTGNLAAKLKSEGNQTEGDIVLALQAVYMEQLKGQFADLSTYDQSQYVPELRQSDAHYLIWERFSGCIAVNTELLKEKGLPVPQSYQDLLKPEYKKLISMPNPKSSSTGYIFLQSLVNQWGEDAAFNYFDKLSENVLQFTSSGSGPISAITQGEAAIGLAITYQPVQQINAGENIEILFFEEGAPYDIDGYAMIEGKQDKKAVKEVFDYLYGTLIYEDKDQFSPEKIFVEQENVVENYPKEIVYADMNGALDIGEKERLLARWKY